MNDKLLERMKNLGGKMVEMDTIEQIYNDASQVINEVIEKAKLKDGQLFIIGCSSSETIGEHMGTASSKDAAQAIYSAVVSELQSRNIRVAVQCCEHLNRAVVVERETAEHYGTYLFRFRSKHPRHNCFRHTYPNRQLYELFLMTD